MWETPWGWIRAGLSLCIVLLITAGSVAPYAPLIAASCSAASFIILPAMDRLWRRRVSRKTDNRAPLYHSANLIASSPSPHRAFTVYLTAHYDTKSQTLSIRQRIALIVVLIAGMAGFSGVHLAVGLYPGSNALLGVAPVSWVAVVLWVAAIGVGLVLLGMRTENRSPGGLDNAGSVDVLLALAEKFQGRAWKNIQPVFVAVGAEELGLLGSTWLAGRAKTSLDPQRTWILNLDGVGVRGSLRIMEGARMLSLPRSRFARLLQQTATRLDISAKPSRMPPGFLLDHIPFSRAGFTATSLVGVSKKIRHVHTPQDTLDLLEPEGLEETVSLVAATLERLDENPV